MTDKEILTPVDRLELRRAARNRRVQFTAELKAEFLQRMSDGEFPTSICDLPHMPTYRAFGRELAADPQFITDYEAARIELCDSLLEDAAHYARDIAADPNADKDAVRGAEVYQRVIQNTVEKLSPRSHGVLVKMAGADGGPLTVVVTNYARPSDDKTD